MLDELFATGLKSDDELPRVALCCTGIVCIYEARFHCFIAATSGVGPRFLLIYKCNHPLVTSVLILTRCSTTAPLASAKRRLFYQCDMESHDTHEPPHKRRRKAPRSASTYVFRPLLEDIALAPDDYPAKVHITCVELWGSSIQVTLKNFCSNFRQSLIQYLAHRRKPVHRNLCSRNTPLCRPSS